MKCPKCGGKCTYYRLGYQCDKCSYSWAASRAGLKVIKKINKEEKENAESKRHC